MSLTTFLENFPNFFNSNFISFSYSYNLITYYFLSGYKRNEKLRDLKRKKRE